MMHIPIYFPGLTWGPTDVMGHPAWGNLAQWWSTSGWIKVLYDVWFQKIYIRHPAKCFNNSGGVCPVLPVDSFIIEVQKCHGESA